MHCPACNHALHPLKTETVMLDVCHDCGGIWFDHHELEKVNADFPNADHTVANFAYKPHACVEENRARNCPHCNGVTLDQKLYNLGSGVILDRCPRCQGVWLDHGELEKIRESIHPGSRRLPAVTEDSPTQKVAVSFDILRQVQILHLGKQPAQS